MIFTAHPWFLESVLQGEGEGEDDTGGGGGGDKQLDDVISHDLKR